MVGGVRSIRTTTTLKLQEARLPKPSTATQVTQVVPIGKTLPEAGVQVVLTTPELSLAVGLL